MSSVPTDIRDSVLALQGIENEHDLIASQKDRIKAIKTELWFLKTFLDWKGKQNRKKLMALQKHVKPLMKSVGDDLRDLFKSIWCRKDEPDQLDTITTDVLKKIRLSKPDIRVYYSYPEIPGASSLTHELVVEFINNVVRNLRDLLIARLGELLAMPDDSDNIYFQVKDQMKVLVKELTVLKKFVCFLGTIYSPELESCWKAFLSHAEVVATNAATVCFFYLPDSDEDKSVALRIANSLIDCCRKGLSLLSHRFATSTLMSRLSGSPPMSSTTLLTLDKDQTETLPDQLKSSRIILNELSLINSIQDEMRNRFFTRLENVAVDAGLVIYSLYDSSKDKEHQKQELIVLADTVQLVKTQVNRDIREWVQSHLPKNDSLGSINFLMESLKGLICCPADSLTSVKNQLELVHEELEFLQPLLKGAAEPSNNKYDEIQDIAARVIDNAHELEDTIDSLKVRDIPLSYFKIWLSVMTEEIKIVKTELPKSEKKEITIVSPATNDEEPVGFLDVKETIRGQLVGGPHQLEVISIVGMPELGKTTLARSFMNDQSIVSHFNFQGECRVSQVYTRKDLLLSILSDATHEPIDLSKEGESELAARLKQTLMRRRYLLIIDNVWEKDAWDDLRLCFPDDDNGSRIILTTRLWEVALYAKRSTDPHDLRLFNNDESWSLLQRKVFGEEKCPEELKQVGQEIAKKCKGLPLSVVLVAGLLSRMDKEEKCWKQLEVSLGAQIQGGTKDLVQLSYYNLPYKLKSCLLYFRVFLEDSEILVSKLTRLWIAEDFIEDDDDKDLEDIAEDYFEDLIRRNLVIVTKKRSIGKIKACRVHDLVLDFCKEKAVEENFLLWLKRDYDDDPPRFYSKKAKQQGLSSNSDRDRIARWSASCSYARSILFREVGENRFSVMKNASDVFGSFKFLRVLDLEFVIVHSFPTELRNLRYFAVRTAKNSIPSSINNLRNLETFQVKGMKEAGVTARNFLEVGSVETCTH
uniref:Late blight resistance protein homolog R1B-17 isoform X1 n=1 Tax=Nicotiana tabacum TaxID=4097 RepID=A0A1S3XSH5_TOBAC|nr:PREDICTED: putative late blight resistance protein homolog R1B-17 isoform X1 [Nicotiana tabacum]XP_016442830.1 PREDICTED: putative late blight resistance protein homolog R1B-17 isoform X1 [Nicotiana tabacum]